MLTALLNPAVVGVALWLGGRANQWQKVPVAAFAAALAVWAFAPVLVFFLLLAAMLGLLSALMIWFARALGAWRDRRAGR